MKATFRIAVDKKPKQHVGIFKSFGCFRMVLEWRFGRFLGGLFRVLRAFRMVFGWFFERFEGFLRVFGTAFAISSENL